MTTKLQAELRQKGSVNQLRNAGFVPGVVYGRGIQNINVTVNRTILDKVFKASGENTLVELEVQGDKTRHVIINEVQSDPVSGRWEHVDFLAVRLDQKIKAEVPLVFTGNSAAVKELGGTLVKSVQHLEIEALPQDLPREIEVNISELNTFEDHITVSNLKVGAKVKIMAKPGLIVASVVPPRSDGELKAMEGEVVEDVSKVEGVVKAEPASEEEAKESESEEKKKKKE